MMLERLATALRLDLHVPLIQQWVGTSTLFEHPPSKTRIGRELFGRIITYNRLLNETLKTL